jgi:hypothetical protein
MVESSEMEGTMRTAVLMVLILFSSVAVANTSQWKDAKVTKISSEGGGAVAVPVGAMMVGVPITKTFYWIETDDTVYVLGPAISKRQMLNVTLYGTTKIAIDGKNAHILDDEGKDRKMPIAEKIARAKAEDPK